MENKQYNLISFPKSRFDEVPIIMTSKSISQNADKITSVVGINLPFVSFFIPNRKKTRQKELRLLMRRGNEGFDFENEDLTFTMFYKDIAKIEESEQFVIAEKKGKVLTYLSPPLLRGLKKKNPTEYELLEIEDGKMKTATTGHKFRMNNTIFNIDIKIDWTLLNVDATDMSIITHSSKIKSSRFETDKEGVVNVWSSTPMSTATGIVSNYSSLIFSKEIKNKAEVLYKNILSYSMLLEAAYPFIIKSK